MGGRHLAPKVPATTAHHAKGWTVFPERGEDIAGAVLGERFEVEKRIGRGGMAEVFLSKDCSTGWRR